MKEIKTTKDYKKFKRLTGNREVSPTRVRKIIESINKVGYITSPIIVNENMEVIDGQGRLQALEHLGMPIEYIVHKGAGINECLSMNIHQTNWTIRDYIKSYAERGLQAYVYLQELIDKYAPISTLAIILATQDSIKVSKKVYNGELLLNKEQYDIAETRLKYLQDIETKIKRINGSISYFEYAILICTTIEEVDLDRLKRVIIENYQLMNRFSSLASCLQSLEDLYNKNIGYPVFIYTEYRKRLYTKLNGKMKATYIKDKNYKYVEEN